MIDQPETHAFLGANQRIVRQSNRAAIFRALHKLGPTARVDLARTSGLNPGTVTHIVDELLASGLVHEIKGGSRRPGRAGRRPVLLQVEPDARYALGIDMARSTVTGGIVNLAGDVVRRIDEPASFQQRERAITQVTSIVDTLMASLSPEQRDRVVGLGVGTPGAVSIRSGQFRPPSSYGDWEEVDLHGEIASRTGMQTSVDNNANTATLAELWFGAGAGLQNFVLLTLGTGVGAGMVLDGDLYRGEHDYAAEIGHVSIAMDGPTCACGNSGCLEMFVSTPRVLAAIRAAIVTGEPSILRQEMAQHDDRLELWMFLKAIREHDPLSLRVLGDVARYLATGIVTIINTLDPDVVFIGREMAAAGEALLEPVRQQVRRRLQPHLRDRVRIEATQLVDAPVIGASILGLQQFFEAPV